MISALVNGVEKGVCKSPKKFVAKIFILPGIFFCIVLKSALMSVQPFVLN